MGVLGQGHVQMRGAEVASLCAAVTCRPEAQPQAAAGPEATTGGCAPSALGQQKPESGKRSWGKGLRWEGCRPGSKGTELWHTRGPSDPSGPCP